MQIVRGMRTGERVAVAERFRERNGAGWTITLGAGGAADDVDPIRGIVRRAKRELESGPAADIDEGRAIAAGAAFLAKNAESLGIAPSDVPALDLTAASAKTTTYGTWVVHARGKTPMRGYEGFESVASDVDVLAYIGRDGAVSYFVNLSRVHPHLVLDTTPLLGPDDKRLLRFVLDRPLFVVVDDPTNPNARVRELRRVPLGRVVDRDVRAVRLTVHVSPGPRNAYVSYFLAYAIDVTKERQAFRFVVDADTGDLLEDASVPVVAAAAGDD